MVGAEVSGHIYLIHFAEPFGHARHYLGYSQRLTERIEHHRRGTGANLLRHVNAAGIEWSVTRLWLGTRAHERRLKNFGGHGRLCPVCSTPPLNPRFVQEVQVDVDGC